MTCRGKLLDQRGNQSDMAEFAVNSIRCWWYKMGTEVYPDAEALYIKVPDDEFHEIAVVTDPFHCEWNFKINSQEQSGYCFIVPNFILLIIGPDSQAAPPQSCHCSTGSNHENRLQSVIMRPVWGLTQMTKNM